MATNEQRHKISVEVKSAVASINSVTTAFDKQKKSFDKLQKTIKTFNKQYGKFVAGQARTVSNLDKVEKKVKAVGKAMATTGKKSQTAGKQMAKAGKTGFGGMSLVSGLLASRVIQSAFGALTSTVKSTTAEFVKLSVQVSELQTISQSTFGKLGNDISGVLLQVKDISNAFNLDQADVIEAQYQAVSNQIAGAAESFKFVKSAAKLAQVSVATLSESTALLSSGLNSFNLSSVRADQLSAKFFKTVEKGRLRINEMSQDLGRSAVLANQLTISIDELLSSFATTTIQGVKFANAQTFVTNVMLRLVKPTEKMTKLLNSWGFANSKVAVSSKGLLGLIRDLNTEFEKGSNALGELGEAFSSIRAIIGGSILGANLEEALQTMQEISTASESFNVAFETRFKNTGETLKRELTKLKNYFIAEIGGGVVGALERMDKAIKETFGEDTGISAAVTKVAIPFSTFVASFFALSKILPIIGAAFTSLGTTIGAIATGGAIAFPPIAVVLASIGATVGAGILLWHAWGESAEEAAARIRETLEETSKKIDDTNIRIVDSINRVFREQTRKVVSSLAQQIRGLNAALEITDSIFEAIQDSVKKAEKIYKVRFTNINNFTKKFTKAMVDAKQKSKGFTEQFVAGLKDAVKKIKDIDSTTNKFLDTISGKQRDRTLGALPANQKIPFLKDEFGSKKDEALSLFQQGDYQGGLQALSEASDLLDGILSTRDDLNDSGFFSSSLRGLDAAVNNEESGLAQMARFFGTQEREGELSKASRAAQNQLDNLGDTLGTISKEVIDLRNEPNFDQGLFGSLGGGDLLSGGNQLLQRLSNLQNAFNNGDIGQEDFSIAITDISKDAERFTTMWEKLGQNYTQRNDKNRASMQSFLTLTKDALADIDSLSSKGLNLLTGEGISNASLEANKIYAKAKQISDEGGDPNKFFSEGLFGRAQDIEAEKNLLRQGVAEARAKGETEIADEIQKQIGLKEQEKTLTLNTAKALANNIIPFHEAINNLIRRRLGLLQQAQVAEAGQAAAVQRQEDKQKQGELSLGLVGEFSTLFEQLVPALNKAIAEGKIISQEDVANDPYGYMQFGPAGPLAMALGEARKSSIEANSEVILDDQRYQQLKDAIATATQAGTTEGRAAALSQLGQLGGLTGDLNSLLQPLMATSTAAVNAQQFINDNKIVQTNLVRSQDNFATALIKATPALANIGNRGAHLGGPIGYATGGGVGATDTIPAMLSPGEFVTKASSAKALGLGNLSYMNNFGKVPGKYRRGTVIQGFADGGEVSVSNTNTFNVGSSGNERVDARRMAQNINREVRRGTVEAAGKRRRPF